MDNKTPIIVALIGVVGTITVALITNWHSIFPPPAPVDRPVVPAATTPAPNEPTPAATTSPAPSTTMTAPGPTPAATARLPDPINIGGQWEDADDDYRYAFTQSAAAFRYSATERGQDRGGGKGTIIGRTLIYDFQSSDGPGNCRATIADDDKTISGSCTRGGETFPVRLRRPTLLPLDELVRVHRP